MSTPSTHSLPPLTTARIRPHLCFRAVTDSCTGQHSMAEQADCARATRTPGVAARFSASRHPAALCLNRERKRDGSIEEPAIKRVVMGQRPTYRNESSRRHPRASGGPCPKGTGFPLPAFAGTSFAGMTSLSTEFPWAFGPPEQIKIIRVARCRGTPWRAPTTTSDG
jgi:hypothetical protein